jgi:hypothetical protein
MAFFTSPGQEVYAQRLKRSTSLTSVRGRSRQTPGTPKSPPPSRIHTHSRMLTLASDDAHLPSTPASPAASPNLNEPDHDSKLLPKLSRSSESRHNSDDSRPPRVSPNVRDPELGQQRQHPDTSSPSSFSPYPRRDFNSGSLSDSGLASHTTHSPLHSNLSSPSSHNVHFSLLHARHQSSSPNLPIAGYFSDGDRASNLLHPSRLDVKRLLSKPAAPSVNSTLSITSDSESNALPRARPSNTAWPSKTKMQVHFQPSSTPPMESMEQLPSSPQPSIQQRPRNLLRKRSGSKQTRATVSATLPGKATTSSTSQPTARSPPASPRTSALPHASSSKLTPAGAIAQAYKEQDLRREALATAACSENPSTVVTSSGSHLGVPDPPTSDAGVANGMPYYTVIGSSPDRIVIVGSVEDRLFDAGSGSNSASTASVSKPIKSLTRKVSARFRRGRPSVSKDGGTHGDGDDAEHGYLPRSDDPSSRLERHQSASSPKAKSKFDPLRLSLDQHTLAAPTRCLDESLEVRSPRPVPSESMLDVVVVPSPVHGKGKQKSREDDTGAGGRLWRLVKRISAGGLRDRFHTTAEPAPPVPPVPVFPPDFIPTRTKFEVKTPITPNSALRLGSESGSAGDCLGAAASLSMDAHIPTSVVRPNADGRPSTSCGAPSEFPATPQGPRTVSQPRLPSISSSSPQSSEPTSTNFFRSHSSRSSFSSIFCGSPPLPTISAPVQSPSPHSTRSRAKSSSSLLPPTPPSCDGPPQTSKSPHARTRKRSSPDIPAFSVSGVINNFIVRRPSLVRRTSITRRQQQQQHQNGSARSVSMPHPEETSSAPPPRPARSDLRNTAAGVGVVHPMQSPGPSVQSHDSQSSSSTERPGSTSTSTISAHAVAGASAAQITFREIGGTRRQAWTSQEKEDKWDDLLKKSARAGGTLHLGADGEGLASDQLRFSSSTSLELERTETEI